MSSDWFFVRGGQRFGPVSAAVLRQLAATGQLSPEDLVARSGQSEWRPAAAVRGLRFGGGDASSVSGSPPVPPRNLGHGRGVETPIPPRWRRDVHLRQAPVGVAVGLLLLVTPLYEWGFIIAAASLVFLLVGLVQEYRARHRTRGESPLSAAHAEGPAATSSPPPIRTATSSEGRAEQPAAGPLPQPAAAPWHPVAIGWLGLVFTPLWSGIMAAVNARRLGMSSPIWPAVTIVLGWIALDLLADFLFESTLVSIILYLSAATLVWQIALRSQMRHYAQHIQRTGSSGSWLVPLLAGSPGAVLTVLAFVVVPLLPLSPRQVCDRFLRAETLEEAKRYSTANLWPALTAFEQLGEDDGTGEYELTDEVEAPFELGGYLIGYRLFLESSGGSELLAGALHLVNFSGDWKVEEVYLTDINGESFPDGLPISQIYKESIPPPENQQAPASQPQLIRSYRRPNVWSLQTADRAASRTVPVAMALLANGRGRKVTAGAVAVVAALLAIAFGRKVS